MASLAVRSLPLLALLLTACSGAENQDLFEDPPEQTDNSFIEPGAPKTPAPSGSTTPAPPTGTGTTPPAPAPTGACTKEIEPNNDGGKATTFTTSLCGKIDNNGDVDFGKFTIPEDAKSIKWEHKESGGRATYRFSVGGVSMPQGDSDITLVPGATYQVRIQAQNNNDKPTYELKLTIK